MPSEVRCVIAMIRQAINDLHVATPKDKQCSQSAFWWIFVDQGMHPLSFAWCCEVMDCQVLALREYITNKYPMECWDLAAWFADSNAAEDFYNDVNQHPKLANSDNIACV
jgi:hypothetical protein